MNMTLLRSKTPTIDVYVKLAQYPVLADKIRVRMREELFQRGVIAQQDFEAEIEAKAIESQRREGLQDPFAQEESNVWEKRKERIRDFLTDAYFANNLGTILLNQIVQAILQSQPTPTTSDELTFNPEIAPWELLFRQGELYEALPPERRAQVQHHLEQIKVVLIKRMISDQLPYIGVAKRVFSMADLRYIYHHRIGSGKIGGKAAGMLLALKILLLEEPDLQPDISQSVEIPESFFIGTEVIYEFRLLNGLDQFMNQKYRPLPEIEAEYPHIVNAHLQGEFPEKIEAQLREVLAQMGKRPIIVRSSSLLEDNFGYSFAGKYNSYFCPNQGTEEENLQALLDAVRRVFASTLNPDAIMYRQHHGLIDYDERMAILLQEVRGKQYGRYFFPTLAGVAFSENPFRWNPKIRREDGFLRLVWGLGTRAVDRVANDYPRMIALSHPQLRPETTVSAIRQYSQWYVDVIDLEDNSFKTLPIQEVLQTNYPYLRYIASLNRGDYLQDILSLGSDLSDGKQVLTFSYMTKDKKFVNLMRTALKRLETVYARPVDVEFTVEIIPTYPYPDYKLHILQCRPLSQRAQEERVTIPTDIPDTDILFQARRLIPDGKVEGIRYVVFVDPEKYRVAPLDVKHALGRCVSRLNRVLADKTFILMGPGRWGSVNIDLGVHITYADIHNTAVLIEIAVSHGGSMPELSYGTHFFQDLVEAGIHSLPLHLGADSSRFNWAFFRESPNALAEILPEDAALGDYLRVIDVTAVAPNRRLNIYMDGSADEAIGFLSDGNWTDNGKIQATISSF